MAKFISNGRVWPYAIAISILLVFGACVTTVVVTSTMPVSNADRYMMGYHQADAKANDLINARIAFDKKYKVSYETDGLSQEGSTLKYKVTDLDGKPVKDAKIKVIVTRPNIHDYDKELTNSKFENGLYVFDPIKLEKPGKWNIMAKINIDKFERYYNIKADTRTKEAKEY